MRIRYEPVFRRDLRRIRDPVILRRVDRKIAEIEAATSVRDISNVSRMNTPSGNDYRVRIGNYRIGAVTLEGRSSRSAQNSAPRRDIPPLSVTRRSNIRSIAPLTTTHHEHPPRHD